MRNPDFLDELLSEDFANQIEEIFHADTDNFSTLAKIAELDPSTSFRFADLEGVDFSNCNLTGFDFTGANLRNTIGVNVEWDQTTRLDDAALEGGFFCHAATLDRQFTESKEAQKEFNRVITYDVYDKSFWLSEVALDAGRSHGKKVAALKLFDEEPNITVRNTFIYNALKFF